MSGIVIAGVSRTFGTVRAVDNITLTVEPGEFCPHADAGLTCVAGDGKTIICENNNRLQREPT